MEEIKKLRRLKGGIKGGITNLTKDLTAFIDTANRTELEGRKTTLENALGKVEKFNETLYDLYEDTQLSQEMATDLEYIDSVNVMIARLATTSAEVKVTSRKTSHETFNLPKLTLPTFEGNPINWVSFWDMFKCSVHDNKEITNIQKLTYLKGQLKGEAQRLVEAFKLETASYEPAIELLKNTYGQPDRLKTALITSLCELQPPTYEISDIKEFHASAENIMRSIENEQVTREEMCAIILLNKTPSPLKEYLKRELKENILDYKQLLSNLQTEIFNLEGASLPCTEPTVTTAFSVNQTRSNKYGKEEQREKKENIDKFACKLCSSNHLWFRCTKYTNPDLKLKRARNLHLCTGCLATDHGRNGCTSTKVYPCKNCGGKHYHVLCTHHNSNKNRESERAGTPTTTACVTTSKYTTILPTLALPLKGKGGKIRYTRALLDQCSQRTFILKDTLSSIRYKIEGTEYLKLQGFTGTQNSHKYDIVSFKYIYRREEYDIQAVVVDNLPQHKVAQALDVSLRKLEYKGYKLADPYMLKGDKLELLIGADNYYQLVHPGYYKEGKLILLPTKCGYSVSGSYCNQSKLAQVEVVTVLKVAVNPVNEYVNKPEYQPCINDLNKLWELDHIGILPQEIKPRDQDVLTTFENTISFDQQEKQYMVQLPWKVDKEKLPTNYGLAIGRLKSLQRKFANDDHYCKQYTSVINTQLERGFIEKVTHPDSSEEHCHYLAHHGVIKDSITTPVRVVFDCSAKVNDSHPSLNDCLYTGPPLIAELAQVLLRFRINSYAYVSDIEKAFLMVKIHPKDRDVTRFLWPTEPNNTNSDYHTYRFTVVLFGATCSQFLLNATILKHLNSLDQDQRIINTIKRGLYIDNLQGTDNNQRGLISQYWIAQNIFAGAHLFLKEWATNSIDLQKQLKHDGVAAENQSQVKVLGLVWNTTEDTLTFQPRNQFNISHLVTKRSCLSLTASIFDPLGILLPITIRGRIFLQNVWKGKFEWDQEVSQELTDQWHKLVTDLQTCITWQFDRKITSASKVEMHIFSDASNLAYGATAYFVTKQYSKLIMAKAKVAPIKPVTIPKLELTAVLLAARLIKFINETYEGIITITNTYLWCDSQITLHWLNSKKILPVYVANRVDEIKSLIPQVNIRYIATQDNPADLLTRGITAKKLNVSSLWWNGPCWLTTQRQWPKELVCDTIMDNVTDVLATPVLQEPPGLLAWERFGSYNKILRTLAWVYRYINNLAAKTQDPALITDPVLRAKELIRAEQQIIKFCQLEGYNKEYNLLQSKVNKGSYTNIMLQLGLFLENGLIKCRGRIQMANCPDNTKYPILLPGSHPVTKLLIQKCHIASNHYGTNYTMSYMRQNWWIPKMRQVIKKELRQCVTCKKHQGSHYSHMDAPPLPKIRVTQSEPFQITGVDYTGALQVKINKQALGKAYVVLFTCAVSRACHLEVVTDLTSQSFLFALRRFTSRQGFPQILMSDNATTFVNAAKYIDSLRQDSQITSYLANNHCEWKFIPARAPWFGAMWERTIGTLKTGLRKVLGRALITLEELFTILLELEATINDRPLTYVDSELNELNPITPSQLLKGRRIKCFPHKIDIDEISDPTYSTNQGLKDRLSYITKLSTDLWKRWSNEYLLSLRESHQCLVKNSGKLWPRVGDIVLIHDDGPRSCWKLGKITGLHMGRDGIIRVAQIKTAKGAVTRPVIKLYPLEQDLETDLVSTRPPADDEGTGCKHRPIRHAALGSIKLWQSGIRQGLL